MESKKSSKGLVALLIFLILMVLGLSGYIVYDKVLKEEPKTKEKEEVVENEEIEDEEMSQSEIEKIVENELYILNDKTDIKEITNNDKLNIVFDVIGKDSFTKTEVLNTFSSLSIHNLGIEDDSYDCYFYDENTGVYTKNNMVQCKRGYYHIRLKNKKVDSFEIEDNKYTIAIKYLWVNTAEAGWEGNVFGNYTDMKNNQNSIKTFDFNDRMNQTEVTATYFEDNYEEIKDKLDTYNYVFEKVDGKITLVDFYIK